jgi:4-oxalocrotonate tautomerase
MPLTRISMRRGKSAAYRKAILNAVQLALRETFDVPPRDFFMTISEHDEENFVYSPDYLDMARSDELLIIQLVVSQTRKLEQKQALYRRIVDLLEQVPGVRPDDVFINLVEVARENWSFGHGVAQYA